jgi:hypothetical protein
VDAQTRALEIFRALGNRSDEAWALNHYAAALVATGQRSQALAMNRELNKPAGAGAHLVEGRMRVLMALRARTPSAQ